LMGCLVPKERLVSGDFIVTGAATDFTAELRDTNALQGDEKFLCVVGCVYYRDDNGIDRRTGFARVCDILKDAGGFSFSEIGIGDEEYEYAY